MAGFIAPKLCIKHSQFLLRSIFSGSLGLFLVRWARNQQVCASRARLSQGKLLANRHLSQNLFLFSNSKFFSVNARNILKSTFLGLIQKIKRCPKILYLKNGTKDKFKCKQSYFMQSNQSSPNISRQNTTPYWGLLAVILLFGVNGVAVEIRAAFDSRVISKECHTSQQPHYYVQLVGSYLRSFSLHAID